MANRTSSSNDRDWPTRLVDEFIVAFVEWLETVPGQARYPVVQAKEQAKVAGRRAGDGALGLLLGVLIVGRLRRSHRASAPLAPRDHHRRSDEGA